MTTTDHKTTAGSGHVQSGAGVEARVQVGAVAAAEARANGAPGTEVRAGTGRPGATVEIVAEERANDAPGTEVRAGTGRPGAGVEIGARSKPRAARARRHAPTLHAPRQQRARGQHRPAAVAPTPTRQLWPPSWPCSAARMLPSLALPPSRRPGLNANRQPPRYDYTTGPPTLRLPQP